MKRILQLALLLIAIGFLHSCARGITPWQAANGSAKCGKTYVR